MNHVIGDAISLAACAATAKYGDKNPPCERKHQRQYRNMSQNYLLKAYGGFL